MKEDKYDDKADRVVSMIWDFEMDHVLPASETPVPLKTIVVSNNIFSVPLLDLRTVCCNCSTYSQIFNVILNENREGPNNNIPQSPAHSNDQPKFEQQ